MTFNPATCVAHSDANRLTFEVIAVTLLASRCIRISLVPELPSHCDFFAGDNLKLLVARNGVEDGYQHYSIASVDTRTRILNLETLADIDGHLDCWAASVVPGEPVEAIVDLSPRAASTRPDMWLAGSTLEVHDRRALRPFSQEIALGRGE